MLSTLFDLPFVLYISPSLFPFRFRGRRPVLCPLLWTFILPHWFFVWKEERGRGVMLLTLTLPVVRHCRVLNYSHDDDEWRPKVAVHRLVATSLTATWHLVSALNRWLLGAGEVAHLGLSLSSGSVRWCSPLFASHGARFCCWGSWVSCDMVLLCPSSAVCRGGWGRTEVHGVLTVHRKIYNNEWQLAVVIHCFVATSPTAMRHLCYRGQWWGHVSLLTSAPHHCTSFVVCHLRHSSIRPSLVLGNVASASCVRKGMGEVSHSPGWMRTVTMTCIVTVCTMWHIRWCARSSPSAIFPCPLGWWRGVAMLSLWLACAVVVRGVERWVWKVGSGYGLWVAVAVDGGGGKETKVFVCWCCVYAVLGKCCLRGSVKERMVAYMIYYVITVNHALFIY